MLDVLEQVTFVSRCRLLYRPHHEARAQLKDPVKFFENASLAEMVSSVGELCGQHPPVAARIFFLRQSLTPVFPHSTDRTAHRVQTFAKLLSGTAEPEPS